MQAKNKLKKIAFGAVISLGMLMTGNIFAENLSASVSESETEIKTITITQVTGLKAQPRAGDNIYIFGENFGTDIDKLTVNLAGEDYPAKSVDRDKIKLTLEKNMRSGKLFLKKDLDADEGGIEIESNSLDIDIKEPRIVEIEAPDGLIGGERLTIRGENLTETAFFCDENQLHLRNSVSDRASVRLPAEFMSCSITAKRNDFEVDTKDEINIIPDLEFSGIKFDDDYVIAEGKYFSNLNDNLSDVSLVFQDEQTLSDPTFVADDELKFDNYKTLLYGGRVSLKVGNILLPAKTYLTNDDFPAIKSVSNLMTKDDEFEFTLEIDSSISNIQNMEVKINSQEVNVSGSSASTEYLPSKTGKIWIEMNGFKSHDFDYEFETELKPTISKIQVDGLNRRIEIFGDEFGKDSDFKINTNTEEPTITNFKPNIVTAQLPKDTPDGEYQISISNKQGSSDAVSFELSSSTTTVIPRPEISEITFPDGPFIGEKAIVTGEGLLNVTAGIFGENEIEAKSLNAKKVELTVPNVTATEGKILLMDWEGQASNEISYKLLEKSEDKIKINFPKESDTIIKQSEDWQNILSFDVENQQKPILITEMIFTIEDNDYDLPFTDYQLIGTDGTVIKNSRIEFSTDNENLSLKKIEIPVSENKSTITLQAKTAERADGYLNFKFEIKDVLAQGSSQGSADIEYSSDKKYLDTNISNSENIDFCRKFVNEQWQDCDSTTEEEAETPVVKKVKRPTSHTERFLKD